MIRLQPASAWVSATRETLPGIGQVLTAPGGGVLLREEARALVALVVLKDGRHACLASDPENEEVAVVLHNAAATKKPVAFHFVIDRELLIAFNASPTVATPRVSAGDQRTTADQEIENLFASTLPLGTTDIHLLGDRSTARVVVRANGKLVKVRETSIEQHNKLAQAIYIACEGASRSGDWNPRQFQDASGSFLVGSKEYRVRYAHSNQHPDTFDVCLRVLPIGADTQRSDFLEAGYLPEQIDTIREILDQPEGLVLLAGPTNSGKSTTIKIALEYLLGRWGDDAKIHTLEDPVEYWIHGVRQTTVPKSSNGQHDPQAWARALSGIMRMDVNILMIGEVRDKVSALLTQQIAETGHKVVTTIHGPNPTHAVHRLLGYGCDRDVLLGPGFVSGVVNQKLLPQLCPECSIAFADAEMPEAVRYAVVNLAPAGLDASQVRVTGKGCSCCRGQGRIGRTVAAEVMLCDEHLMDVWRREGRDAADRTWRNGKAGVLANQAHISMFDHAMLRVYQGLVCPLQVDLRIKPLATLAHARSRTRTLAAVPSAVSAGGGAA